MGILFSCCNPVEPEDEYNETSELQNVNPNLQHHSCILHHKILEKDTKENNQNHIKNYHKKCPTPAPRIYSLPGRSVVPERAERLPSSSSCNDDSQISKPKSMNKTKKTKKIKSSYNFYEIHQSNQV